MSDIMKRIAIVSLLALAGNVLVAVHRAEADPGGNCAEPAPSCSEQDDCDDPGYPNCDICYPNPLRVHCTSNN